MNASPEKRQAHSLSEAVQLALSDLDRAQREQAIEEAAQTADPEGLVGLIATEDAVGRNAALEALTRAGRRGVPALLRALTDTDPEVVMFAASTLGKTRDASVVPHLVRVLGHEDINVCQAAIESLGMLRAVPALSALEARLDGHVWLRFSVVHSLGEIGHASSIQTLTGLLGDKQLREGAICALGKVGGAEAIGQLGRLLQASESLAEFTPCLNALGKALARVSDASALQRIPSWSALARSAERSVVPWLIEILRHNSGETLTADDLATKEAAIDLIRCLRLAPCYPEMVAAAAEELLGDSLLFAAAELGGALGPHLVPVLAHENRHVRLFACRALGAGHPEQGVAVVARLLTDPDDAIRAAAVRVLSRLHCTESLGSMLGCLSDAAPTVLVSVIDGLTHMDARAVTLALMRNPQVASQHKALVLSIMRKNPHPAQRGFLEACLGDPDEGIRHAAVGALAAQPGMDLVECLEPSLADRSVQVRREAINALSTRRCERTRQLLLQSLESDPETRGDCIRGLRRIGDDRLVPKLIAVFESCTPTEQVLIVDTLGALEATRVEPFLAQLLGHHDPNVRSHVVTALARRGTASALYRLSNIAIHDGDARVRQVMCQVLASCPHPIARGALERLSLDSVNTVAAAAGTHLGR